MERLTWEDHNGGIYTQDVIQQDYYTNPIFTGKAVEKLAEYEIAEENKQIMKLPDHKIIDQLKIREIIYAYNGNYAILFWNGDREFYRTQDELYQAIVNKLKEDKQC